MNPLKKIVLPIVSLLFLFFLAYYFLYLDAAHPKKFLSCRAHNLLWETSLPLEEAEIDSILDQKFTYLGQGKQSYVFESKDKKYVLKFPKMSHFIRTNFLSLFPLPQSLGKKAIRKKNILQNRLIQYLDSQRLCFEKLSQECALVFCHINPSENLSKQVRLQNKWGKPFLVDLDTHIFVVQKKMISYQTVLKDHLKKNEKAIVQDLLRQMIDFHAKLLRQGLIDTDKGFYKNYGILNDEITCLDTGNFISDPNLRHPMHFNSRFNFIFKKMRLWVGKNIPEQKAFLEETIQAKMQKN